MVLFKPKFSVGDVETLLRFYWVSQTDRLERIERDIEYRVKSDPSKEYLTRDEFRLVCSWTAHRAVGHYENNNETTVREITKRAFSAKSEKQRIVTLTELEGVAYPVASTILHFFHREIYPILTYPSLWSLGVEKFPFDSFDFWMNYTQFFRQLATEWGVNKRDLDRALWQYHHNKTAREIPYSDDD